MGPGIFVTLQMIGIGVLPCRRLVWTVSSQKNSNLSRKDNRPLERSVLSSAAHEHSSHAC